LYIGQLCANVQDNIYQRVLPIYFEQEKYFQPHVKDISKNIDKLYQTDQERRGARGRWRDLQQNVEWDTNLEGIMEELMEERNNEAHPNPLDDDELKVIASKLPGQKRRNVEKIIHISKKLKSVPAFSIWRI
jgi:hypothetical protein